MWYKKERVEKWKIFLFFQNDMIMSLKLFLNGGLQIVKKINIHYSKRKCKQKKSAYQKLLERNEYLEAENEFLKKLSALCNSYRA